MKKDEATNDPDFSPEIDSETSGDFRDIDIAQVQLKKLREELSTAKKERQEYLDGWQRCKADSVNARKETIASAERAAARTKESFLEDLIPVLDGFDMATGGAAWQSLDSQWRNGIDQLRNQLLDVLARHGVERFGAVGDTVDPSLHEVIEERDEEGAEGAIIKVVRYGYKVAGRVVRAAHVAARR